jgi:predicted kinase
MSTTAIDTAATNGDNGKKLPILFIFSGLPGVGKTTLARQLAQATGAVFLRIDTIEQGLREICGLSVGGEGYRLSYRIASDNLQQGHNVIADCCNPVTLTRNEWNAVAQANTALCINIEVICSNQDEHRRRVENRVSDITGFRLPSWPEVLQREYHAWHQNVIRIDTAGTSPDECLATLLAKIGG